MKIQSILTAHFLGVIYWFIGILFATMSEPLHFIVLSILCPLIIGLIIGKVISTKTFFSILVCCLLSIATMHLLATSRVLIMFSHTIEVKKFIWDSFVVFLFIGSLQLLIATIGCLFSLKILRKT